MQTTESSNGLTPHPIRERVSIGIFALLAVTTWAAVLAARSAVTGDLSPAAAVVLVVLTASINVAIVASYQMHLRDERNWKYLLLGPALFLAFALVLTLVPDVGWPLAARAAWNAPVLATP